MITRVLKHHIILYYIILYYLYIILFIYITLLWYFATSTVLNNNVYYTLMQWQWAWYISHIRTLDFVISSAIYPNPVPARSPWTMVYKYVIARDSADFCQNIITQPRFRLGLVLAIFWLPSSSLGYNIYLYNMCMDGRKMI